MVVKINKRAVVFPYILGMVLLVFILVVLSVLIYNFLVKPSTDTAKGLQCPQGFMLSLDDCRSFNGDPGLSLPKEGGLVCCEFSSCPQDQDYSCQPVDEESEHKTSAECAGFAKNCNLNLEEKKCCFSSASTS